MSAAVPPILTKFGTVTHIRCQVVQVGVWIALRVTDLVHNRVLIWIGVQMGIREEVLLGVRVWIRIWIGQGDGEGEGQIKCQDQSQSEDKDRSSYPAFGSWSNSRTKLGSRSRVKDKVSVSESRSGSRSGQGWTADPSSDPSLVGSRHGLAPSLGP